MAMDYHYEHSTFVPAAPEDVFAHVDDHSRLSSHMSTSSWMMGGGQMAISTDSGRGQRVGSHIRLRGEVLGIDLSLEEVVTERDPPHHKLWVTIGNPRLLVVGQYRMGFDITPHAGGSMLSLFIDYELPTGPITKWLGLLLGSTYAKWCTRRMAEGVRNAFARPSQALHAFG
jgi:hypothetical protein